MFAFNTVHQKQNTPPSPAALPLFLIRSSHWHFHRQNRWAVFLRVCIFTFSAFFSAVGCRSQILEDWPTGSCHAGNQEGYLQETLDFIVLPTGTAFLLPAADSAQRTYSDISRKNKTYVPYELHGRATPVQHKFCKTHSIAKEHLHLQPGFISQPTALETASV